MTNKTPEQLVAHLRERFANLSITEMQGLIVAIWLAGSTERLTCLGVIRGSGKLKEIDGMDQWAEIDKHRYRLIPPNMLGYCLVSFAEVAATEELRAQVSELMAMYYTDAGRQEIAARAFDRIFMNSPAN